MQFLWYLLYTLCFIFYSASATCTEEYSYRYEPGYAHNIDSPFGRHHGFGFPRCTYFSSMRYGNYRKLLDSVTVTCSNVSSTILLDYKQHHIYRPHDLIVQNSMISKLSSNSSLSKIQELRKLVLKNLSIEDISPGAFEGLNSLEILDLSFNQLVQIPSGVFDKLSTLKSLDLRNNSIKTLERKSISGLVGLQELYLSSNNITVLADDVFSDLRVLQVFDMSDNPLEDLHNLSVNSVKKMFLKNTRLKKFEMNLTQSQLIHIDVSGSQLESINFDNLPSLEQLILSRNHIKVVRNWDKLRGDQVFLDHNNCTEVDFSYFVEILDLSHNQISSLKNEYFHPNNSLKVLNLAFNEISMIRSGTFSDLANLEVLRLEHNNIIFINGNTFLNCPSLKTVDLSHNDIRSISNLAFNKINQLKFFNISHNRLTTLSSSVMTSADQLGNLYVDNNELVWFDARSFDNLKTLSMNGNSWSCEDLRDILHVLKIGSVDVIDATSLDGDNIDGIACSFNKKS